jgi:hypothetical protein
MQRAVASRQGPEVPAAHSRAGQTGAGAGVGAGAVKAVHSRVPKGQTAATPGTKPAGQAQETRVCTRRIKRGMGCVCEGKGGGKTGAIRSGHGWAQGGEGAQSTRWRLPTRCGHRTRSSQRSTQTVSVESDGGAHGSWQLCALRTKARGRCGVLARPHCTTVARRARRGQRHRQRVAEAFHGLGGASAVHHVRKLAALAVRGAARAG